MATIIFETKLRLVSFWYLVHKCTLEKIITVFRIGNRQLVAGCRFDLVLLNRQLNRQLVSESLTGGREGFWYDKDRCGVI